MPEIERRLCPPEYQDRLTEAVGLNLYGEPNFRIAWGQGTDATYTAGGVWSHDHFYGYRQLMLSNSSPSGRGIPCWMILEWHPPDDYETPEVYYFRNRDEATGLQTLGEYPYQGRYEVAFKLISHAFINGRLQITPYHLDGVVLDLLIPIILEGQRMSQRDRLKWLREREEEKDHELETKIDAIRHNAKRRLLPSQIDNRVRLIQKQMSYYMKMFGRPQPGFKINAINA